MNKFSLLPDFFKYGYGMMVLCIHWGTGTVLGNATFLHWKFPYKIAMKRTHGVFFYILVNSLFLRKCSHGLVVELLFQIRFISVHIKFFFRDFQFVCFLKKHSAWLIICFPWYFFILNENLLEFMDICLRGL